MAILGLKNAELALAASGAVGVPLPSGNVWRDRLIGAVAHGDADKDWAVRWRSNRRAPAGWLNQPVEEVYRRKVSSAAGRGRPGEELI